VSHDLFTLGEAMLRLWVAPGARLETAPALRVTVGGAEANVAVAVARMGRSAAWSSRLPASPLGRRVAAEIGSHGVDVDGVRWVEGARLGTYFVELSSPPRPTHVIYDRAGSAASSMSAADVPWDEVESARVVHLTGITPALSASCRQVCLEVARRARASSVRVTVDVNYRSALWPPADAAEALSELCTMADLVIVAERDARTVFGIDGEPSKATVIAQERFGVESVVLTRGATGAAWRRGDVFGEAPAVPVRTIDRIGAGDAFAAGVILGLLEDDLARGVDLGRVMAALTIGTEGDQFRDGPVTVDRVLSAAPGDVRR
jgi:2-dehydro-3-deoxygluconokinase